jgi:hypothetical protein
MPPHPCATYSLPYVTLLPPFHSCALKFVASTGDGASPNMPLMAGGATAYEQIAAWENAPTRLPAIATVFKHSK